MDILDHAANVLKMFDIEPRPLDRLLDQYLRRHREIGSRQRRLIAEAVFGVTRWRRRIDGWFQVAGVRSAGFRERAFAYLLWKRPEGFDPAALAPAPLPAIAAIDLGAPMPRAFPGGLSAYHSFPDMLYECFIAQYGEAGAVEMATCLNSAAQPTLRVNRLRCDRASALRMLLEAGVSATPTERSPYGIRLSGRVDLASIEAFRRGFLEVQDEASQLAVLVADPRPGERVLDACAGAGGKSLMMAMLLENRGRIVASDIDRTKLQELERRAARAGVSCIAPSAKGPRAGAQDEGEPFDLVFIDAPCSGTGTLRRSPDLRWRLTRETLLERAAAQRELLEGLSRRVRPGGRLLYATCSLLEEENEAVVEAFLRRGTFEIIDARAPLAKHGIAPSGLVTSEGYFKADPRGGGWDGFFAAALRRKEGG